MNQIEYLTTLKSKVEKAKEKKARLEGNLEMLFKKLKEEFDVDTLEEAQELLEKKQKQLEMKQTRLDRSVKALKDRMEETLE